LENTHKTSLLLIMLTYNIERRAQPKPSPSSSFTWVKLSYNGHIQNSRPLNFKKTILTYTEGTSGVKRFLKRLPKSYFTRRLGGRSTILLPQRKEVSLKKEQVRPSGSLWRATTSLKSTCQTAMSGPRARTPSIYCPSRRFPMGQKLLDVF
jgi:hypothetical protein